MPIIHIDMFAGRTQEQKENLVKEVTEAVIRTIDAPAENVHIVIHELPRGEAIAQAGKFR